MYRVCIEAVMIRLRCQKKDCQYAWDYNGKAPFFTSCPRCKGSVNVNKHRVLVAPEIETPGRVQ